MRVSIERLNEAFAYDPTTGSLINKIHRPNSKKGAVIGTPSGGYLVLSLDQIKMKAHRVVWRMHFGEIPDGMVVDHIDHDRKNNRLSNLRLLTKRENLQTHIPAVRKPSGVRGVSWNEFSQAWRATIKQDGKKIYLGQFKDKERAIAARKEAEKRMLESIAA